jgi:LysM repeat protein
METNESNIKPQPTGGLKLMTVFVVVLAFHVVAIGSVAAYYMLKGGSADVDLTDKSAKVTTDGTVATDAPAPDNAQGDKTASTAPADASSTAATAPAPAPQTGNALTTTIVSSSAPAPTAATPTGPVISPITPTVSTPMTPIVSSTPAIDTPTTTESVEGTPYTVKISDSLAKIAHQNHVSVTKLKAANGLTNNLLHVGQKLLIPAKGMVASTTKTDLTGTPATLTETTSVTPEAPAPVKKALATTATPDLATPGHHVYTVVKGDTLTKIAHKFKTTTKAIMAANSLTDAAKLSIGEKLKIPSKESRSATITPAPTPTQPSEVQAKPATITPPSDVQSKPAPVGQLANFVQ